MAGEFIFVINPIAGGGHNASIVDIISAKMSESGIPFNIKLTEFAGHAKEIARKSIIEGAHTVVAVGGDGTVNEVASALIGYDIPLGIIPLGSGNGLAYHLGIDNDIKKALDRIVRGHITRIDNAFINGIPFFCTSGVGFDAKVAYDFEKSESRGLLTYSSIAIRDWKRYSPELYQIETDNDTIEIEAFLITVGNANQWGNNFHITPQASLSDGLLDVTIIKPFSIIEGLTLLRNIRNFSLLNHPKVVSFKTNRLEIYRQNNGVAHYDGEVLSVGNHISPRFK